jgi:hypothetical protein
VWRGDDRWDGTMNPSLWRPVLHASDRGYDNWLANDATSGWVSWPDSQLQPTAGGWCQYEIQFDLTGYDPATVEIKGRWLASDKAVAVQYNGVDTTNPGKGGAWRDWVSFTLNNQTVSGGLKPGANTLRFLTWNNDGGRPDFTPTGPSGLRVEFENATGQHRRVRLGWVSRSGSCASRPSS